MHLLAETQLHSPWMLVAGLLLVAATSAIAWRRQIAAPGLSKALALTGLVLLALAAAGVTWQHSAAGEVVVLIDLSPSTRSAEYRQRDALMRRIDQLLGRTPYRLVSFAQSNHASLPEGEQLGDWPGEKTVFDPPAASAVVLFSDGRFDPPPVSPPVYAVIDPALESPTDAAVKAIEIRDEQAVMTVTNAHNPRELRLSGTRQDETVAIPAHPVLVTAPFAPNSTTIAARLSTGDMWPENDALAIPRLPTEQRPFWWVGGNPPGGPWRQIAPQSLPISPADYLSPAAIVLDNLGEDDLSSSQQTRLEQYVRDLGGTLLIVGGDRAFPPTTLESLSPLAGHPPTPVMHWLLLADASGSMAQPADGATRWQRAANALTQLLQSLPATDLASVGSFSDQLRWWAAGQPVRQLRSMAFPPAEARPGGPTNLAPALEQIAAESEGRMARPLLVMTDAETDIDQPEAIIRSFRQKQIRLHILAIGQGKALPILRDIAEQTGGRVLEQLDPAQWAESARQLMRSAAPNRVNRSPVEIRFIGELSSLGVRAAAVWNRTWLKEGASDLATAHANNQPIPVAARWQLGAGQVLAAAWPMPPQDAQVIAARFARPPRDPRFTIVWQQGAQLRLLVDALEPSGYLNGLELNVRLKPIDSGATPQDHPVPQTAPGRYEVSLPASRRTGFAILTHGGRVLDRIPLPARYPPEFEAIGNDHVTLLALARRSGGRVIAPADRSPIAFDFPPRPYRLDPLLSLAGALCLGTGLVWWRVR